MFYTVYSCCAEECEKRLARIAKKAEKYGVSFSYAIGEEYPKRISISDYDPINHCIARPHDFVTVSAVDFTIECEGLIKANGWTILAKIEHGEQGNIVTPYGTNEPDSAWYTAPARCDHCGTNRCRAVTFMCKHEDGRIRQVGRSCLKDYTGIIPQLALLRDQVTDIVNEETDWSRISNERSGRMFDVVDIVAFACDSIKAKGYIKSGNINSTRDQVIDNVTAELRKEYKAPSADGVEKAERIVEWLKTYLDENPNAIGIERDCVSLAKSGYAKIAHIGRLAYMPLAYDRYIERKQRDEQRKAEVEAGRKNSGFVGNVGDRITVVAATAMLVTSWETQYGYSFLYRFVDADGNVFIWKSTRCIDAKDGMTIKGTVKDHGEYDGIKQTVLTRCKAE